MAIKTTQRAVEDLSETPIVRAIARSRESSSLLDRLPRKITQEGVAFEHHIREGRFQRGLSLIAGLSGLLGGLEVMYEHYRGSYGQRIMYSPAILSPLVFIAGVSSVFSRKLARTLLPLTSLALLADGVIGFLFHIRGVARKPGGWRIPVFNVVMGPPLFAPLLLGIGGFLGLIASLLRREDDPRVELPMGLGQRPAWMSILPRTISKEGILYEQEAREGRLQRTLAAAAAISALLNGMEALYSHYKNNFTYKVQWTPILLSPIIMFAGIGAVFSRAFARTLLPITSALALLDGMVGFFYHVRGIGRRAGGFKKPFHNIVYGPPVFAPLLYAATGFLGLLASLLRRGE